MSKVTLNPVASLIDATTAVNTINSNTTTIQTSFDNTLSRDGTSPNQMQAPIDMNSNQIVNLPVPSTVGSPLRMQDLITFNGGGTITNIPPGGTTGQALTKSSNTDYNIGWAGVSNSGLTNSAAATIKGNPTVSSATPTDFTIQGLSDIITPSTTLDFIPIFNHTTGTIQKTTPGEIGAVTGAGVSSFNGSSGAVLGVGSFNALTGTVTTNITKQVFTSSGTYTPTAGMAHCIIECVGGGGGGGSGSGVVGNYYTGAGGGSGGYSRLYSTAATIGASKAVTIGTAGTAGATGGNAGGAGGDTSVGVICIGKGGSGGGFGSSTTVPSPGAGGIAGTGDVVSAGMPGLGGVFNSVNVTILITGGGGGSSIFGGGANSVFAASAATTGANASNYGSGGGGGVCSNTASNAAGGSGSAGVVIVTEFINL